MATTTPPAATWPTRVLSRLPRRRNSVHGSPWTPWLFAVPAVVYLLVFQGIPMLLQFLLSFTDASLLQPFNFDYVGLANYSRLIQDPNFQQTITVTAIYVVACVVGSIGIGLGTALFLNQDFAGRRFARALVIIPWAAPPVAVALIATWMLNAQYGIVNRVLTGLGIIESGVPWLVTETWALPAILVTTIWQLFPFTSIVLLAALQAVPTDLLEAARVDGAGRWATFKVVVWTQIRPTVALLTLFMTIWSVRRFELIWLMTQGGPLGSTETLVIDLYRRGFQLNQLGPAAAVGIVGFIVSITVTIIYFAITARANKQGAAA